MVAYYNEIERYCCDWLSNLMDAGEIPAGRIDDRDLWDVEPLDLMGYDQVHLCAGLGGWPAALRRAGWADDRPIWSCSAPCQPFSAAGARAGFADERHLWPAVFWHINQCRPDRLIGEQVSSRDGLMWLDLVCSDLENAGYACGATVFPSAGVGAPNIRHRIWWCADRTRSDWVAGSNREHARRHTGSVSGTETQGNSERIINRCGAVRSADAGHVSDSGGLGDAISERHQGQQRSTAPAIERRSAGAGREVSGGLGDPAETRCTRRQDAGADHGDAAANGSGCGKPERAGDDGAGLAHAEPPALRNAGRWIEERRAAEQSGGARHPWRELERIDCSDGRQRPTESPYVRMVARLPASVARSGSITDTKEEIDGKTSAFHRVENLQGLQQAVSAQKNRIEQRIGVQAPFQSSEVLQSSMHGLRHGRPNESSERSEQSTAVREKIKTPVRALWESTVGMASLRTPPGYESSQQRPAEFEDIVWFLSSPRSLQTLHGRGEEAHRLRALCETIRATGPVLHAFESVQEIWQRLDDENKKRIKLSFDMRGWEFIRHYPLKQRVSGDVQKLRAFGNAINVEAAAAVITAWMGHLAK